MVENSSKIGSKNCSRTRGDACLEIRGSSTNASRKSFRSGCDSKSGSTIQWQSKK